jgi:hypothetical protein
MKKQEKTGIIILVACLWMALAISPTLAKATTKSNPAAAVGGIVAPVDKFGLLAPYISLGSTMMIGAVATVVYVERVKRRKEKQ